jgi:hypothetical protein
MVAVNEEIVGKEDAPNAAGKETQTTCNEKEIRTFRWNDECLVGFREKQNGPYW